jgi:NAD(P)-dependent dehydrogenase (short-subunit alcohol dehydrogenase family)
MAPLHREEIDRMIGEGKLLTARWGVPDDVARVIRTFAHGDFDYSTGQTIEIDGCNREDRAPVICHRF